MVYVKLIRNTYGGPMYLKNACGYVQSHDLCAVGGYGVNPYVPDLAYTQMSYIKIYYGKESGNPLIHIMISLDDCAQTKEKAYEFADQFARYYMDRYQVTWAVHGKKAGFIALPCSFDPELRELCEREDVSRRCRRYEEILQFYRENNTAEDIS